MILERNPKESVKKENSKERCFTVTNLREDIKLMLKI